MRLRTLAVVLLALAVAGGTLYSRWRGRAQPPVAEPEGEVVLPSPSEPAAAAVLAPVPRPTDVQPTLDRLFDGALEMDVEVRPAFVSGDFSGDSAADFAVAVRPRGGEALSRLNVDVPRFRLQDATAAADGRRDTVEPIAAGERLLVIVHGVAGEPWTSAADRPCYLVRNAVGPGMRVRPLGDVPAEVRMQVTRAHTGDVIEEARQSGRGVLLWTGAAYVWARLPGGTGR